MWRFFQREKRFDQWQRVPEPPLEGWLELLDVVQWLITRRRYQPDDEEHLRRRIRERFPEAKSLAGVGFGILTHAVDVNDDNRFVADHPRVMSRREH